MKIIFPSSLAQEIKPDAAFIVKEGEKVRGKTCHFTRLSRSFSSQKTFISLVITLISHSLLLLPQYTPPASSSNRRTATPSPSLNLSTNFSAFCFLHCKWQFNDTEKTLQDQIYHIDFSLPKSATSSSKHTIWPPQCLLLHQATRSPSGTIKWMAKIRRRRASVLSSW